MRSALRSASAAAGSRSARLTEAVHAAAVYQYDVMLSTFKPVAGTSGASATRSPLEASYAMGWARNLWADMLG